MFCAAFVGLIVRAIKFRRNKDKKILASNKQKLLMEETELQQDFFFRNPRTGNSLLCRLWYLHKYLWIEKSCFCVRTAPDGSKTRPPSRRSGLAILLIFNWRIWKSAASGFWADVEDSLKFKKTETGACATGVRRNRLRPALELFIMTYSNDRRCFTWFLTHAFISVFFNILRLLYTRSCKWLLSRLLRRCHAGARPFLSSRYCANKMACGWTAWADLTLLIGN